MNKEELEEAMSAICSIVSETILDYEEDGEEDDAEHLGNQLELIERAVAIVIGELK